MAEGSEDQQATGSGQRTDTLLAPGDRVAGYVVVRLIDAAGRRYLARLAADEPEQAEQRPPGPLDPFFHLVERPAGGHDQVRHLLGMGLRHPRLLALREIILQGEREFLVIDSVGDVAPAAPGAPRLEAAGALAAGVGLADALTYLHRQGVAHLHVSPATVVIMDGRAQLGALEHAEPIHPLDPQAARLFARDANFLALTLGALAGVGEEAPASAGPAVAALATIVQRGAAQEFARPEDVGLLCSEAVPAREVELPAPAAPPATTGLGFVVASATSVGRVRTENQDAAASALFEVRDDLSHEPHPALPAGIFLVADGMGGEERGELASRIAARVVLAEAIRHLLLPVLEQPVASAVAGLSGADAVVPSLTEALVRAGRMANVRVRELSTSLGRATGTTLTAILAVGTRAALIHVGDSRAYLLRAGRLTQLSEDHSLLARMQAIDHPLLSDPAFAVPRNYLYRALGQEGDRELEVVPLTLTPGDRLLLCSDGLWDEIDDATLLGLLAQSTTPRECAEALVAAADNAGGSDNSTAVVVFVQGATAEGAQAEAYAPTS
jgi:protein phosphatase